MSGEILRNRLKKEIMYLDRDPPPGISCYPKEDNLTDLEANIKGPPDSPYEKGLFKLDIKIPQQYPFDPPQIRFVTYIYHPNIDDAGRICADILKKGVKGGWNPALNLSTTLLLLRQLLANPNPDDPLDAEIAKEYQLDYPTFKLKATEFTLKLATEEALAMSQSREPENNTENEIKSTKEVEVEEDEKDIDELRKPKLSLSRKKGASSCSQLSSKTSNISRTAPNSKINLGNEICENPKLKEIQQGTNKKPLMKKQQTAGEKPLGKEQQTEVEKPLEKKQQIEVEKSLEKEQQTLVSKRPKQVTSSYFKNNDSQQTKTNSKSTTKEDKVNEKKVTTTSNQPVVILDDTDDTDNVDTQQSLTKKMLKRKPLSKKFSSLSYSIEDDSSSDEQTEKDSQSISSSVSDIIKDEKSENGDESNEDSVNHYLFKAVSKKRKPFVFSDDDEYDSEAISISNGQIPFPSQMSVISSDSEKEISSDKNEVLIPETLIERVKSMPPTSSNTTLMKEKSQHESYLTDHTETPKSPISFIDNEKKSHSSEKDSKKVFDQSSTSQDSIIISDDDDDCQIKPQKGIKRGIDEAILDIDMFSDNDNNDDISDDNIIFTLQLSRKKNRKRLSLQRPRR